MGTIIDISAVLLDCGLSDSVTDEERAIVQSAITRAEGAVKRYLKYDPVRMERTEFYPQANQLPSGRGVWEVSDTQAYRRTQSFGAGDVLQLKHIPIRAVAHLYIDYDGRGGLRPGSFTSEKTEGEDFWPNVDGHDSDGVAICRDGILRYQGAWPATPLSVKVVYTAGYSAAEFHGQDAVVDATPIGDAVLDEATRRAKNILMNLKKSGVGFVAGAVVSEKLGDYSYTLGGQAASSVGTGGITSSSGEDLDPGTKSKLSDFVNYAWVL